MSVTAPPSRPAPGRRRRAPRERPRHNWSRPRRVAWLAALVLATAVLVTTRTVAADALVGRSAAGLLAVLLATGLAARTGGRVLLPGLLAAAGAGAAVGTGRPSLLAGMAVTTGVLGAALAVMATVPAATFARAVREVLVACVLSAVAALGVAGFAAPVDVARYRYVVLALSLVGTLVLVYSLGAGLHGLGRRGKVVAFAAVLLLAVALAYSQALSHWGSPGLVGAVDRFRGAIAGRFHGVPHAMEVLLGVPALAWGVFMRARRRQGWWVAAFGTTLTAPLGSRLLGHPSGQLTTLLSAGYSLLLGLALACVVIRVEQVFTGTRGRRARRDEEAGAHRPEPGRLAALQ